MIKKTSILIITFFFFVSIKGKSQKNFLQGIVFGLPFQSGAGMGNISFEHHNILKKKGWQIGLNVAGGTLTTDIGVPKRIWLTFDNIWFISKQGLLSNSAFISLFMEAGKRTVSGGRVFPENGSILNRIISYEINPGIGIGKNFRLGKKAHFQLLAGPKMIIGFMNNEYKETASNLIFKKSYTKASAGYRVLLNFCFPLGR